MRNHARAFIIILWSILAESASTVIYFLVETGAKTWQNYRNRLFQEYKNFFDDEGDGFGTDGGGGRGCFRNRVIAEDDDLSRDGIAYDDEDSILLARGFLEDAGG
ncbi:hypothetical protein ElyMa_005747400 [Elysia marginata]|uniref:Uncharacterized protein n=1 Tax=Elysia marginata TaxID=1093978 RepID=A0AAV4FPC6_9GAST|nr:hypothetical protein ElyMa_005747400 [Elysia marginata]